MHLSSVQNTANDDGTWSKCEIKWCKCVYSCARYCYELLLKIAQLLWVFFNQGIQRQCGTNSAQKVGLLRLLNCLLFGFLCVNVLRYHNHINWNGCNLQSVDGLMRSCRNKLLNWKLAQSIAFRGKRDNRTVSLIRISCYVATCTAVASTFSFHLALMVLM